MEITGKVHLIGDVQKGTSKAGKEWKRQNLVIDTGDEYNPYVSISFLGTKTELLDKLSIDEEVTVSINISSNEWEGRWFTNVNGWKIESHGAVQAPATTEADEDLPF